MHRGKLNCACDTRALLPLLGLTAELLLFLSILKFGMTFETPTRAIIMQVFSRNVSYFLHLMNCYMLPYGSSCIHGYFRLLPYGFISEIRQEECCPQNDLELNFTPKYKLWSPEACLMTHGSLRSLPKNVSPITYDRLARFCRWQSKIFNSKHLT